jgi:beta-N-acetylglucosaminidase
MDIQKEINRLNKEYTTTVALAVVNFAKANDENRAKLLESYQAILRDQEDEEYHNRELQQNQGMSVEELDQYLDDPRHGQSSKGEH